MTGLTCLVLGASGMLGSDISAALRNAGVTTILATSQDVDISDKATLFPYLDAQPALDWVINCAAYTAVDDAESHKDLAFKVNGDGPTFIGEWAARHGVKVFHFSTDYVFNGQCETPYVESDETDPINVYGASKLAGETGLLASDAKAVIFRIQWLYGLNGKHFVDTICRLAAERDTLHIVADQWGSPTWTGDIAKAVCRFIQGDYEMGVYHFANEGVTHWADFARYFLDLAGIQCEITDISSASYPTPATRPLSSRLCLDKYKALGESPRSWQAAVTEFMERKRSIK